MMMMLMIITIIIIIIIIIITPILQLYLRDNEGEQRWCAIAGILH